MDADPSMLGTKAGLLQLGYQNIKGMVHSWFDILLNVVAPRETLNGKFWMPAAQ